jgi:hypothetical protein
MWLKYNIKEYLDPSDHLRVYVMRRILFFNFWITTCHSIQEAERFIENCKIMDIAHAKAEQLLCKAGPTYNIPEIFYLYKANKNKIMFNVYENHVNIISTNLTHSRHDKEDARKLYKDLIKEGYGKRNET